MWSGDDKDASLKPRSKHAFGTPSHVVSACSLTDSLAENENKTAIVAPTPELMATGAPFTDALGRRWLFVDTARYVDGNDESASHVEEAALQPSMDPAELGRERLAEQLRPTVKVGDQVYRLSVPDYELADAILATRQTNFETSPGSPKRAVGEIVVETPSVQPKFVFFDPNDDRVRSPSVQWRTAHVENQRCTLQLIGRYVAVSAAHCFYSNGAWVNTTRLAFGSHNNGTTSATQTIVLSTMGSAVWLPGGWMSNSVSSNRDWDFALVNFATPIGDTLGWWGTGTNNSVTYLSMYSYDGDKPWGSQWVRHPQNVGEIVGVSRKHWIDLTPGASGACLVNFGDNRCYAIQTKQTTASSGNYNEARDWDSTTHNFVATYGTSWP